MEEEGDGRGRAVQVLLVEDDPLVARVYAQQLLAQLHVWLGAAAAHVERDVTTRLARMA